MEKNIPFFKKVILSIKDLDKYSILISEKLRRAVIYFLEIMLIFTLVISAVMTYKTNSIINDACEYVKNNISDFTIDSNSLNIESGEPIIIDDIKDVDLKIIFDSQAENKDAYQEKLDNYEGIAIVGLKDKMLLITGSTETEVTYKELTEMAGQETINKETLLNIFEQNSMALNVNIFIALFGVSYFMYALSTIIDALALSLLVIILSKIVKIPLKYTQCLIISISALTLPILLNLIYTIVNILNGFYIPYFTMMYTIISYIYVGAVILIMKSDLLKKKQLIKATMEVKKLEKEQEAREGKEEKDNKKENKEDREEKNKTKDKKEKKSKDDKKENEDDNTLDNVKKRVKNKLKEDKENPEPQANIEGGKG